MKKQLSGWVKTTYISLSSKIQAKKQKLRTGVGLFLSRAVLPLARMVVKTIFDSVSSEGYVHLLDRRWSIWKLVLYKVSGQFYYLYQSGRERLRVFLFNLLSSLEDLQILWEFVWHSRGLLLWLLLLFAVTLVFHYRKDLFSLEYDYRIVSSFSLNFFTGLISVVGIILAFYGVGFQITTSKYSSEVTDFINSEQVGKFFFRLLVFSILFSLGVFMLQMLTSTLLVVPFIMSILLSVVSILGLLIYKDDYVTKLKPKSIFQLIFNDSLKCIASVNEFDSPSIKDFRFSNRKSLGWIKFTFEIKASWNLYRHLREKLSHRIRLTGLLFSDLIKEGSFDDATFGVTLLGYLMVRYVKIKPYIDRQFGWWFPTFQEPVKDAGGFLYTIKANYEAQGLGVFSQTKSDINWVETSILNQLESVQNNPDLIANPKIVNSLIYSYETILAGQFEKTDLGNEKNTRGLFELQDFENFEKTLDLFLKLSNKLPTNESCKVNYLNCFGQIKTVIADGFSLRRFPGTKDDWREKVLKGADILYKESSFKKAREKLIDMEFPRISFEVLIDYAGRLEVERRVEGKLITSEIWIKNRIIKLLEDKEIEVVKNSLDKCIKVLLEMQEKNQDDFLKNNFSIILLQLFNQLITSQAWEGLESIIEKYQERIIVYLAKVPANAFMSLELREPIELGLFSSLVNRKKSLFKFYLRLFVLSQMHLHNSAMGGTLEKIISAVRRPLVLGALAYFISELDGDVYYANEVTAGIQAMFPSNFIEILETSNEARSGLGFSLSFNLISQEEARYRGFFDKIRRELGGMSDDWFDDDVFLSVGLRKTGKHPSRLIRKMGSRHEIFDIEFCIEEYIEWLKKRIQIKKIVSILNYK